MTMDNANEQRMEPEKVLERLDLELSEVTRSSEYKISVAMKRMKQQMIQGDLHEKIDFCRYVINTLTKHHIFTCKPRYCFDTIYQLRAEVNTKRDESFCEKEPEEAKRKIFIFSGPPVYYTGGGQRWVQLARTFMKMGYQVRYYYCEVLNALPLYVKEEQEIEQYLIFKSSVEEVIQLAGENDLFLFEMPEPVYVPYLDAANKKGIVTLYEQVDNWKTSIGKSFYNAKVQQYFWDHCDYLSATCRELCSMVKSKDKKEVHYNANAVNEEIFNPAKEYEFPLDLVQGKDKTVIYFGTVWGRWIDWDLICETARRCPESEFNFIGERNEEKEGRILESNIHFLGAKEQKKLPAYLQHSDIAIIPFKLDEIGVYVSPIKVFEYLSMEKTVLATSMPEIKNYPNTFCGNTPEEWSEIINRPVSSQPCKDFIIQNSWKARCRDLLEYCHME